jgi:hypothetical protein
VARLSESFIVILWIDGKLEGVREECLGGGPWRVARADSGTETEPAEANHHHRIFMFG